MLYSVSSLEILECFDLKVVEFKSLADDSLGKLSHYFFFQILIVDWPLADFTLGMWISRVRRNHFSKL